MVYFFYPHRSEVAYAICTHDPALRSVFDDQLDKDEEYSEAIHALHALVNVKTKFYRTESLFYYKQP